MKPFFVVSNEIAGQHDDYGSALDDARRQAAALPDQFFILRAVAVVEARGSEFDIEEIGDDGDVRHPPTPR
jgi:hypothetical protein